MIGNEPLLLDAEKWDSLPEGGRLRQIADYLYRYRRSSFTHSAVIGNTPLLPHRERLERPETPTARRGGVLLHFPRYPTEGENVLTVMAGNDEGLLLRLIVGALARSELGLPVTEEWVETCNTYYWQTAGLVALAREMNLNYEILNRIRVGWQVGWWEARDFRQGVPSLATEVADVVATYDLSVRNWSNDTLRDLEADYLAHIRALNEAIVRFNRRYPPPQPDDEQRRKLLQGLFRRIARRHEFHSLVLGGGGHLRSSIHSIIDSLPSRSGIRINRMSAPLPPFG